MANDIVARLLNLNPWQNLRWPEVLREGADEIALLQAALRKIAEECQNTGYGSPIVMERMIDRIKETALDGLGGGVR